MALRLARAFNISPELWLGLQQQYDLWRARRTLRLVKVKRLVPRTASNATAPRREEKLGER
jgi:plasmid maintenance system antidote protein VapI